MLRLTYSLVLLSSLCFGQDLDPLNQTFIRENLHLDKLQEFGFTPESDRSLPDPKGAKEGIDLIFGGQGFRMYVPEDLFKILLVSESGRFETQRQWLLYGNTPSPKSRKVGGRYADGGDTGLSYGITQIKGERYVSFTCFQCHAGMVAGKLVAGVGNAHIDQNSLVHNLATYKKVRDFYDKKIPGPFTKEIVDLIAGLTEDKIGHLRYFTLYSETVLSPVLNRAQSRGDDYGPYPVWQLFARLKDDPSKTGFEVFPVGEGSRASQAREALIQNLKFGPVDRRPWWLRKHDTKSYVYGDTLASPESGKDFALNFTVPHFGVNETYPERAAQISTILKFALQTKAPTYPKKLDRSLVLKGEKLYDSSCARCHGQFVPNNTGGSESWILKYRSMKYAGKNPTWVGKSLPEVLYSVGVDPEWTVDTDPYYNRALQVWGGTNPDTHQPMATSLTGHAAGMREYFKTKLKIADDKLPAVYNPKHAGYRAPPLVGIWASAPYLHNGSVPTLHDLFEVYETKPGEDARLPVWVRVYDTSEEGSYDFEHVGLSVEVPADLKMPKKPVETYDHVRATNYRRFYNTALEGYSNKGARTCGPNLKTQADKLAVIEFLKALSDETVKPEGEKSQWGLPLSH